MFGFSEFDINDVLVEHGVDADCDDVFDGLTKEERKEIESANPGDSIYEWTENALSIIEDILMKKGIIPVSKKLFHH